MRWLSGPFYGQKALLAPIHLLYGILQNCSRLNCCIYNHYRNNTAAELHHMQVLYHNTHRPIERRIHLLLGTTIYGRLRKSDELDIHASKTGQPPRHHGGKPPHKVPVSKLPPRRQVPRPRRHLVGCLPPRPPEDFRDGDAVCIRGGFRLFPGPHHGNGCRSDGFLIWVCCGQPADLAKYLHGTARDGDDRDGEAIHMEGAHPVTGLRAPSLIPARLQGTDQTVTGLRGLLREG